MSGEMEKAVLTNTVTAEEFSVLFNPTEYAIERSNSFATLAVPGREAPILQFVAGAQKTLTMELMVDSREQIGPDDAIEVEAMSDVRIQTDKITNLMNIDGTTHAPPPLLFTWGSLTFSCVLSKVTKSFNLFLPSGIPIRAKLGCVFSEFRNIDLEAREVRRETADYTKRRIVGDGDSLPVLAAREYGDPAFWRVIAIANGLNTPRRLETGQELQLPRLPFRDRLTGDLYE